MDGSSKYTNVSKKNYKNFLDAIRFLYEIDYGKVRNCKKCGKRLNHMNAKVSSYCHTCKYKVVREHDIEEYSDSRKIRSHNNILRRTDEE